MRDVEPTPNTDIFDMRQGRMKISLKSSILLDIAYKAREQALEQIGRMEGASENHERRVIAHYRREISEIESFIWLLQRTRDPVEVDNVFLSRLLARYAAVKEQEGDSPFHPE